MTTKIKFTGSADVDGAKKSFDGEATITDDAPPVPPVVNCEWGAFALESAEPIGQCKPNGMQTYREVWRRSVKTPSSGGGAPCVGEATEIRESERPCVYVPPVDPPPATGGHPIVTFRSFKEGTYGGVVPVLFDAPGWIDGFAELLIDGIVTQTCTPANKDTFFINTTKFKNFAPHRVQIITNGDTSPIGLSKGVTFYIENGAYTPLPPKPLLPVQRSPYAFWVEPQAGIKNSPTKGSSYVRGQGPSKKYKGSQNLIKLEIQMEGGKAVLPFGRVKFTFNNVPFTDWLLPTFAPGNLSGWWQSNLDTLQWFDQTGDLGAIHENINMWCEQYQITIDNNNTPLLGPQPSRVTMPWYDMQYGNIKPNAQSFNIDYPGTLPRHSGRNFIKRKRTPFPTLPLKGPGLGVQWNGFHSRELLMTIAHGWARSWAINESGDLDTHEVEQYHYYDQNNDDLAGRNGEARHATCGHFWKMLVSPSTGVVFGLNTQGNFFVIHEVGRVITIGGDRKPNDRPVKDFEFELIGDWDAVAVKGFLEAWGFCWDSRDGDINDPKLFWKTFLIADTFHNRVIKCDLTPLMTKGGKAKFTVWAGAADGTKGDSDGSFLTARFDGLWDIVQDKVQKHLFYGSDRNNGRIVEFNDNTKMVRTVFRNPVPMPRKLGLSSTEMNYTPPAMLRQRAGAQGVGTCWYPASLAMDSKNILQIASSYATDATGETHGGCVFSLNIQTQTVSDAYIAPLGRRGPTQPASYNENGRDITIALSDGTCGPIDSVWWTQWGGAGFHQKNADGKYTAYGTPFWDEAAGTWTASARCGPAPACSAIPYQAAVGCANGLVVMVGVGCDAARTFMLRLLIDQEFIFAKYFSGRALLRDTFGLLLGLSGYETMSGIGFAELCDLDDALLGKILRRGCGLPYDPALTDAQIADMIFAIKYGVND